MASDMETLMKVLWYSLFAVPIIIIVSLSLIVICSSKKLRNKPPVVFIISLLISHMIQGIVVMPVYAFMKSNNYLKSWKPYLCDIFRFSYMLTFYGTCLNVLLISIDRLLATMYIFTYRTKFTMKHYVIAATLTWMYMLLLCLIPFLPIDLSAALKNSKCHYNQPQIWTIYMLIACTVLPYISIIAIYIYIIKILKESSNNAKTNFHEMVNAQVSSSSTNKQPIGFSKKDLYHVKITKLTFKLVLIYGTTWAPSITYYLLITIYPSIFPDEYYVSQLETILTFFIKYITFFDAVTAPVIYCYHHDEFRKETKKLYGRYFCAGCSCVTWRKKKYIVTVPKTPKV